MSGPQDAELIPASRHFHNAIYVFLYQRYAGLMAESAFFSCPGLNVGLEPHVCGTRVTRSPCLRPPHFHSPSFWIILAPPFFNMIFLILNAFARQLRRVSELGIFTLFFHNQACVFTLFLGFPALTGDLYYSCKFWTVYLYWWACIYIDAIIICNRVV